MNQSSSAGSEGFWNTLYSFLHPPVSTPHAKNYIEEQESKKNKSNATLNSASQFAHSLPRHNFVEKTMPLGSECSVCGEYEFFGFHGYVCTRCNKKVNRFFASDFH